MDAGAGTLGRRQLGRALRQMRERAGLTGEQAARYLERSPSWLSRVEGGRLSLRVRDLHDLLAIYGGVDQATVAALEELAREGRQRGWWSQYTDTMPELLAIFVGFDDAARQILTYEDSVIPGLLQTEAYMRGLFALWFEPLSAKALEDRVAVRLQRQAILQRRNAPVLDILLEESVLHRAYGGPDTLRAQLRALQLEIDNETAHVRVIPFSKPTVLVHSFTIMSFSRDPDVVFAETVDGMTFPDGAKVAEFKAVADYLREAALDEHESKAAIERALRDIP